MQSVNVKRILGFLWMEGEMETVSEEVFRPRGQAGALSSFVRVAVDPLLVARRRYSRPGWADHCDDTHHHALLKMASSPACHSPHADQRRLQHQRLHWFEATVSMRRPAGETTFSKTPDTFNSHSFDPVPRWVLLESEWRGFQEAGDLATDKTTSTLEVGLRLKLMSKPPSMSRHSTAGIAS